MSLSPVAAEISVGGVSIIRLNGSGTRGRSFTATKNMPTHIRTPTLAIASII
jgi:hypothetical protein